METLLRKYLWAVDLAGHRAVRDLPGPRDRDRDRGQMSSAAARPPSRAARAPAAPAAPPVYTKQVEEILKRNIFCSTCPPILGAARAAATEPPVAAAAAADVAALKLLAIMFAPPPADPRWSVAIIRDNDDKSAGPYDVGSKIREATVDDIEEDARLPRLRRRPARVPGSARPAGAAAAAPGGGRARGRPADPLAAELDKGIKKTRRAQLRGAARDARLAAGQHGRARQGRAHRPRDEGRQVGRASACSASGPTGRSRRSACRTATSSRRSTASR